MKMWLNAFLGSLRTGDIFPVVASLPPDELETKAEKSDALAG